MSEYTQEFGQLPGQPMDDARVRAKGAADASLNIRAAELLRTPLSPRRTLTTFADELHRSATLQKARHDATLRMREFCTEMTLVLMDTGAECEWCRANEGQRFSVQEDPNEVLAQNCSCAPYPSATFHPAMSVDN